MKQQRRWLCSKLAPDHTHSPITVSTSTVASNEQDDAIDVAYDVEFIDLDVKLISAESRQWISGESALMEIRIEIANHGINRAAEVEIGFECDDGSCSGTGVSSVIPAGETIKARVRGMDAYGTRVGKLVRRS